MANSKNQDVIELIIKGQDEYSDVSEEVRQELDRLAKQVSDTQGEFTELERSLDLAETYREQEAEVNRLAEAQALAKIEVDKFTKANKEAKGESLELVTQLAKTKAELGSLRTQTNRTQKAFDQTKDAMRTYGVELKSVEGQQNELRATSGRLSDELVELNRKQGDLVGKAKEQTQAARDQTKAQDEQRKATEKLESYVEKLGTAEREAAQEKERVRVETERVTAEIKEQVEALNKGEITWEDYKRRVGDAGRVADLSRKQVAGINQALDEQVVAARQTNQSLKDQTSEAQRVEDATEKYRIELDKLVEQYKDGKVNAEQFERAEASLRNKLKLSEDQVEQVRREMRAYGAELEKMPQKQVVAQQGTDKLTKVTRRLAQAYTVLLAAKKTVDTAMMGYRTYTENENAMLGVAKTTNLTATELNGLNDEMKRLSSGVTQTTTKELLNIAEAAGRMGIQGADNIRSFTTSINALSSATGLAGDETAQAIAQILNVTGEAQSNVGGVASAIAELGNTSATTEEQIVHFAKRLASDTATVKLTSAEVLGLGTAMAEMGLQAEGSSTVIGRTFRFIEDAIKGGGKPMEDLQRITGQTSKELIKAFGENKVKLFNDFITGMGRMQDGGATLNQILSDMGIKSDENARILGLLTQRHEGLSDAVERSNKAFKDGNAHFEELAKKEASLSSSFGRLRNRTMLLTESMGEAFSDDLMRAIDATSESGEGLEEQFADLGETTADMIEQIASLISTLTGVLDPIEMLMGDVGLFDGLLTGLSMNMDLLSVGINLVTGGVAELGIAWNKFFGDTDDVEQWTKTQEDAFGRIDDSVKRYNDNLARLDGESSRAFTDLRDTYRANSDALSRMDEEQRKAVETIINHTGYLKGNDAAYRVLTRAVQRAAEEKRILKGLTDEENVQLNARIELLKAQGVEESEAIRIAKEKAEQQKIAAEAEQAIAREKKEAADKEAAALEKQLKKQNEENKAAEASVTKLDDAYKSLGFSVDVLKNKVTEQGQAAVDAFGLIVRDGYLASDQIREAFDNALSKTTTVADAKILKAAIKDLRKEGKLVGRDYQDAFSKINAKVKELKTETPKAKKEVEDLNKALEKSDEDGSGYIGDLTEAMKELAKVVKALGEEYRKTTKEADKLAMAENDRKKEKGSGCSGCSGCSGRSKGSGRSHRIPGRGSKQYYDLMKSGNTEAAAIFKELLDAYNATMVGKSLGMKYIELKVIPEIEGLASKAVEMASQDKRAANQAQPAQSSYQQPSNNQPTTYIVKFDFEGRQVQGQFDPSSAEALLNELSDMFDVSQ